MRIELYSTTHADTSDIILVPVYLRENGTSRPVAPGLAYATDLVFGLPRSETWAVGTLEILHRIDTTPEGDDREIVAFNLGFAPPRGTQVRLIIDSPAERLATDILEWIQGTAIATRVAVRTAEDVQSRAPSRSPYELLPPGCDRRSMRSAVLDGNDLNLAVDVLILDPRELVPIELSPDEDGNGWEDAGQFRYVWTREF